MQMSMHVSRPVLAAFMYRACMSIGRTLSKRSIFSPLCTSWMRLSLVFTYLAASGATAANLLSLFRGQKVLTVGYALPEMPLSVGSKLELLWTCLLPNTSHTHALVCICRGLCTLVPSFEMFPYTRSPLHVRVYRVAFSRGKRAFKLSTYR